MGWKESMHVQTIVHPLQALGHRCEVGIIRPSMGGGVLCVHTLVWHKTRPTKNNEIFVALCWRTTNLIRDFRDFS